MNTRVITGLALTGVLVLASCMQDQGTPLSPTNPSLAVAPGSCSFSVINTDARTYFTSNKDVVFTLIDAMQTAYKAGGASGATAAGFDVLWRVGTAVSTTAVNGTPAQGSTFVNDVFSCMAVAGYTYPTSFVAALDANGLFAVRNGSAANALNAVVSRGLDTQGYPLFGAERTGAAWGNAAGALLFYGNPTSYSSFTIETPDPASGAFQLNTLPTPIDFSTYPLKTGVCTMSVGARILHKHATSEILPNAGTPGFCAPPVPPVGFRGVMQRVGDWFTPKPLYAYFALGGGSALVGDLSPLGPVTFSDSLVFVQAVPNARVSDTLRAGGQFQPNVAVKAITKLGKTPLIGVTITLTVIGNKGSYLDFNKVSTTTAPDGIAYFPTYYIDKAGGYTISATSEFGTSVTSNQFNISGQ